MAKPRTQEQSDRATNLRLQKTYGITLEEYNKLLKVDNGTCWICGRLPGEKRLHVDHDHSWTKTKLEVIKEDGWYSAFSDYKGRTFSSHGNKSRSEAVLDLKRQLKRASVRGVLCWNCNRGLKYYRDTSEILRSAAGYIDEFMLGRTALHLGEGK